MTKTEEILRKGYGFDWREIRVDLSVPINEPQTPEAYAYLRATLSDTEIHALEASYGKITVIGGKPIKDRIDREKERVTPVRTPNKVEKTATIKIPNRVEKAAYTPMVLVAIAIIVLWYFLFGRK